MARFPSCPHKQRQILGAAVPHVNVARIKNFWLVDDTRVVSKKRSDEPLTKQTDSQKGLSKGPVSRSPSSASYRTRLLADVVTGKLEFRKAAAESDEPRSPCFRGDGLELWMIY